MGGFSGKGYGLFGSSSSSGPSAGMSRVDLVALAAQLEDLKVDFILANVGSLLLLMILLNLTLLL